MTVDIDLNHEDIQSLNNREAIAAFLSRLRYATDTRIKQDASNLGITADTVVREINHIEQLAAHDSSLFIYLFELSSVTVGLTNSLAHAFRNKQGNYLLVLTSDYERIDFVLLQRVLPSAKDERLGPEKPGGIHPRVLTIDRRKPTRRQLRVLRRFTYTEPDPYAQFDKLLSAYSIYDWSEDHFNNRALFSDYYLQERLRETIEWKEDVAPFYHQLRSIFPQSTALVGKPESEIRTTLFEKIFSLLGFKYKEQKSSKDDSKNPDYLLFGSDPNTPVALTLCYSWGRSLDGKDDQRDIDTPEENPAAVVVSTLKEQKPAWAIVTNGKLWRLYNGKVSSVSTSYYEIDLEEILAMPQQLGASGSSYDLSDSLRYFWLFFRKEAFESQKQISTSEGQESTFLDSILKGSEEYAKRLGERLKDRVFEEVFPYLAEGFVEHIRHKEGNKTEFSQERLDEIFQATLTLLYRLLFMLYAESRDLFPVKEVRGYYEKSLSKLKREIAEAAGEITANVDGTIKKKYASSETHLYERLLDLFACVDEGESSINVPMYNGGLFLSVTDPNDDSIDARLARFLLSFKVPDRFLALGLDLLARDEDEKSFKLVFIDYKSLGVRQLGSIYEGLLEFKLRIALEKMALVKGKKTDEVVPYKEAVEKKLKIVTERKNGQKLEKTYARGMLYIENDRRERKATGSYYTPDYIVKYIVEHTVGPVLEEKFKELAPEFRKAQKAYQDVVKGNEAFIKQKMKPKDPELVATRAEFAALVDKLFDVKVLDPAMGSGHFLVEGADFISDRLIDFLNGFPWNPVIKMLKDIRETIMSEMEKQGVSIDEKRLTDVNLIKRHVLKRCIYGVDLNPMAVELAKVSLWLNCFTLGAPLSFLDHHLKCGNSLIGVSVDEVQEKLQSGQLMLGGTEFAGLMLATDLMRHVGELSDVTAEQVKESQREYRKASDALAPFRRILDVYTSRWFGNEVRTTGKGKKRREVHPALEFLQSSEAGGWLKDPTSGKLTGEWKTIAQTAQRAAEERRFFHWELEFPEVFYEKGKKKINAGFDTVVGNPPYVSFFGGYGQIEVDLETYFAHSFKTGKGRVSTYAIFLERMVSQCNDRGFVGLIIPNTMLMLKAYADIRQYLLQQVSIRLIINHGEEVFSEADVPTMVLILEREMNAYDRESTRVSCSDVESKLAHVILQSVFHEAVYCSFNIWNTAAELGIITKMKRLSLRVDQLLTPADGINPGPFKEILETDHRIDNNHFAAIDGKDIDRYSVTWDGLYFNFNRELVSRLQKKKPNSLAVLGERERFLIPKKIVLRQTADRFIGSLDGDQLFGLHSTYQLTHIAEEPYDELYCLTTLNSLCMAFYYSSLFRKGVRVFPQMRIDQLRMLSIRRIQFTSPPTERARLAQSCKQSYQKYLTNPEAAKNELLQFIDSLLPKDEGGNFLAFKEGATGAEEKSDVVHDFLAFLAEEMIRLNKEKQAEVKRFLSWLEKKVRIAEGIDTLSGKTILKGYLGDYQKNEPETPFEEILKVLQKNKSKLGVSLSQPKLVKELRDAYETSLITLLPIKRTLAATDQLIDQVVYKLYGLTEEEIKVVEGR